MMGNGASANLKCCIGAKEKWNDGEDNISADFASLQLGDNSNILTPPPSEEKTPSQKSCSVHSDHNVDTSEDKLNVTESYIESLKHEREELNKYADNSILKHVYGLIEKEIARVENDESQQKTAEPLTTPNLFSPDEPRLIETILIPVDEFPTYNFVGRILGPRGFTARQLEQRTGCRITIRGRENFRKMPTTPRSMSSPSQSSSPQTPSSDPLRVEVSCSSLIANAAEVHKTGIAIVKALLIPPADGRDELKRQQLMDLAIINGTYRPNSGTAKLPFPNCSGDAYGPNSPFQKLFPYGTSPMTVPTCPHEIILRAFFSLGIPATGFSNMAGAANCQSPKCAVLRSLIEQNVPLSEKYAGGDGFSAAMNVPKVDGLQSFLRMYQLISASRTTSEASKATMPQSFENQPRGYSHAAQTIGTRMCSSMGKYGFPKTAPSQEQSQSQHEVQPQQQKNQKKTRSRRAGNPTNSRRTTA